MEPEDEFANAAAELFSKQIAQFARWLEQGWRMSAKDARECEPARSDDFREGWNRALESIPDALKLYLEPNG